MHHNPLLILHITLLIIISGCTTTTIKLPEANLNGKTSPFFSSNFTANLFFKGNIHTHTNITDGDASPEEVVARYRDMGYDFLAITDHDTLIPTEPLKKIAGKMTLLNGVEVTASAKPNPKAEKSIPVHVNAICGFNNITATKGIPLPVAAVLRQFVEKVHADSAIAMVNHPNFGWALGLPELAHARPFELLEIASAHPFVNEKGRAEPGRPRTPSTETLWDMYLSAFGPVFGAAVDDSHDFKNKGEGRFPGVAWIQVWAKSKKSSNLCQAIREGHFYSTKGPELSSIQVTKSELKLSVKNWNSKKDRVEFIGYQGVLLQETTRLPATYRPNGKEIYVRAKIIQNGKEAWTQAYFLEKNKN